MPARQRVAGLRKALAEHDDVTVVQHFRAKWERKRAEDAFEVIVKRYPEVKVFWAASDSMALGVLDGARRLGKLPGKDFITGGIDLLPDIQPLVGDIIPCSTTSFLKMEI